MKKIDIHCHTTNRTLKDLLVDSATTDAIKHHMQEHDIKKTVLLATYFPHKGSGISNFRLLHWINDPCFVMFASLDFENYLHQGLNEITELAQGKYIHGIKIYTCYQTIEDSQLMTVLSLAREYDLPVMFHTGYSYSTMRRYGKRSIAPFVKASDLVPFAKVFPDVDFILSHMNKPFFDEMISAIEDNPNIYTDMSGLIDSKYNRDEIPEAIEAIRRLLGECGPSHLLFGTDFPVQTHEDSIMFIEQAMNDYPESDRMKVYYDNASRILNI